MFLSATLVFLAALGCFTCSAQEVCSDGGIDFLPANDVNISLSSDQNVTYSCTIREGNVVWMLNDYQLIDRDQFAGIMVQEHMDGDISTILLRPEGRIFLREHFDNPMFRIRCLAVTDEVNVRVGETREICVYGPCDKVSNLRIRGDNVEWDRPCGNESITYNVTFTNLEDNTTKPSTTTTETWLPLDSMCQDTSGCNISVIAQSNICTSDPEIYTYTLPRCSVTYFQFYHCLKCNFADNFRWGVQFVFTISNELKAISLTRSEAMDGTVSNQIVTGDVVEAYAWDEEDGCVDDTPPIPTEIFTVDSKDQFPCDIPVPASFRSGSDDDDDTCGTICIIIVVVVGVVCLILGALLGALLGYCLYKSYSCKDGKKRDSTELSEKTKRLYD